MQTVNQNTNKKFVLIEQAGLSALDHTNAAVDESVILLKLNNAKTWLRKYFAFVPVVAGLLLSTSAIAQKTTPDPGVGGTVAGFEVDADFVSGYIPPFWTNSPVPYYPSLSTYGDDWSKGSTFSAVLRQIPWAGHPGQTISDTGLTTDGHSLWQFDGNWGNKSAISEKISFKGNSNKNGDDIRLTSTPYSLQTGGSGPQKNDITQTFLHTRNDVNTGDLWFFFAAETRSTDGNSYIDVEYNQAGVTIANNKLYGPANSGNIVNGRTVNDFIIVVNYTGGGNRPVVGIRKWLSTGQWSAELPLNTGDAFMVTNIQNVNPVAPNRAFTTDGAFSNVTGALQLIEGGVNIDALNLEFNACTPEATVTIKTRSSSSFTAELKDLDVMNFSITPPATATLGSNLSLCASSDTTRFHIVGTYSGGTPNFSVTGGTKSNQTIHGDSIEADVDVIGAGTNIARIILTVSNTACGDARDTMYLSVSAKPGIPSLSIVNPDCSHRYGTITVTSPANTPGNVIYEYSYNNGSWDTAHIFSFQGGDGYNVRVRAIASPDCISDANTCAGDVSSSSLAPEKVNKEKYNNQAEKESSSIGEKTQLKVYPNPFSSLTTIEFATEKTAFVTLKVYDLNGRLVNTLFNNNLEGGTLKQITLDGSNLADGMYVTHLIIDGNVIKTSKIIIQK